MASKKVKKKATLNIAFLPRELTIRERLLDLVLEYAGDEFETVDDAIKLAKETDDELLGRVETILEYYHQEANR